MPSITENQWRAIRQTAFAVARDAGREAAREVIGQTVAANRAAQKPHTGDKKIVNGESFTYFRGEWRRDDALMGLCYLGEPCRMNFAPCPPIEYTENSRLGKILRTTPRPDLPRREGTAPVSIPTTGFYMVVDARCYEQGAGPDHAHPWFLYPPKMLHSTEAFATAEAERLSTEHGVPFIVLTSVKMVDVKPATTHHTDMKPVSR